MILSFAYKDLDSGWTLEETLFGALNLLVGPSGAGKTRILEALRVVQRAALSGARNVPSATWELVLKVDGKPVVWEAETSVPLYRPPPLAPRPSLAPPRINRPGPPDFVPSDAHFVSERIDWNGRLLIERRDDEFRFGEQSLPHLSPDSSAIGLLSSEDTIRPIYEALRLWRPFETLASLGALATVGDADSRRRSFKGELDFLRRDDTLSPFLKLYFLQGDHPELFERIVEDFAEVFETVQEVRVATYADLGSQLDLGKDFMANSLALALREEGVPGWVLHTELSSGMAKTLTFLIEAALAPKGTVLLIDELENSLGVNCLPEVAGRMLQGLDRVQYVATSHHPRVIHEIPFEHWKLVTRRGSTVRVLNAKDNVALRRASSLEKFTELINLPEYLEGVA